MPQKFVSKNKSYEIEYMGKTERVFITDSKSSPKGVPMALIPEGGIAIPVDLGITGWKQSKGFRDDLIGNGGVIVGQIGSQISGPRRILEDYSTVPTTWLELSKLPISDRISYSPGKSRVVLVGHPGRLNVAADYEGYEFRVAYTMGSDKHKKDED